MRRLRSAFAFAPITLFACGGGDSFETGGAAGASAGASGASTAGAAGIGGTATTGGKGGAAGSAAGAAGTPAAGSAGATGGTAGAAGNAGDAGKGGGGAAGVAGTGGASGTAGAAGKAGGAGTASASGNAGAAGASAGNGGAAGAGNGGAAGTGNGGAAGAGNAGAAGAGNGGAAGAGAGGGTGGGGSAGNGGAGGAPTIIYVSSVGSDAADGTTPATAKATVAAGVAAAIAGMISTVRVTRGSFALTQTLDVPASVSVSGGWTTDFATSATGYTINNLCEGAVDPALLTRLSGATISPLVRFPQGSSGSLVGVDVAAEIVGVRMEGSTATISDSRVAFVDSVAAATTGTRGVEVIGGAPTLTRNCIKGGGGTATTSAEFGSVGVLFTGGATGTLGQSRVEGGSGAGASVTMGVGSAAIAVQNASPELSSSDVRGGSGKSSSGNGIASTGILVRSTGGTGGPTNPAIHDNVIGGGAGTNTTGFGTGSVGISLHCYDVPQPCQGIHMAGSAAVHGNVIDGGRGKNAGGQRPASGGVWAYGSGDFQNAFDLELFDNGISGGSAETSTVAPGPIAVSYLSAKGTIARNSIIGGLGRLGDTTALALASLSDVDVYSNMVYAAWINNGSATELLGLSIDSARRVRVRHNTIVTGFGAPVARGIKVTHDTNTFSSTQQLRVESNLFVGGDPTSHYAIELDDCPAGRVDALQGNAFVNLAGRAISTEYLGPTCVGGTVVGAVDFVPAMKTFCSTSGSGCSALTGALDGNVDVLPVCIQNVDECAELLACTSMNACGTALFSSWSIADSGRQTLIDQQGWSLRATLPCAIARAPQFISGTGPDRFGTPRTDPAARGAHEQEGCQ